MVMARIRGFVKSLIKALIRALGALFRTLGWFGLV